MCISACVWACVLGYVGSSGCAQPWAHVVLGVRSPGCPHIARCASISILPLARMLLGMRCSCLQGMRFLVRASHLQGACFSAHSPRCTYGFHTPRRCVLVGDVCTLLAIGCAHLEGAHFLVCAPQRSGHDPRCAPLVALPSCVLLDMRFALLDITFAYLGGVCSSVRSPRCPGGCSSVHSPKCTLRLHETRRRTLAAYTCTLGDQMHSSGGCALLSVCSLALKCIFLGVCPS